MTQLATIVGYYAPALIAAVGARPIAFSNSSPHRSGIRTPAARMRGLRENSSTGLRRKAVTQLAGIQSVHVATYIERLRQARSAPTAKLRLAGRVAAHI
jgi:hypothetical protein